MLYKVIMALIKKGKTEGLEEKVDIFYADGKLTDEEYEAIMAALHPETEEV